MFRSGRILKSSYNENEVTQLVQIFLPLPCMTRVAFNWVTKAVRIKLVLFSLTIFKYICKVKLLKHS